MIKALVWAGSILLVVASVCIIISMPRAWGFATVGAAVGVAAFIAIIAWDASR